MRFFDLLIFGFIVSIFYFLPGGNGQSVPTSTTTNNVSTDQSKPVTAPVAVSGATKLSSEQSSSLSSTLKEVNNSTNDGTQTDDKNDDTNVPITKEPVPTRASTAATSSTTPKPLIHSSANDADKNINVNGSSATLSSTSHDGKNAAGSAVQSTWILFSVVILGSFFV